MKERHGDSSASSEAAHDSGIASLDIYKSYKRSPFLSKKHASYFQVYTDLLERYRNRPITFVEIGVMNGGSLFMWRDYLGEKARIIGIDLNPGAKKWEKDGFEIYVGSQSDPRFWRDFFQAVGPVDVVLDDGGHTFEQQIFTVHSCIPWVKDGGLIIVEDTHTSYYPEFGYPTRHSFIEWTKVLIDNINSRFRAVKVSNLPYKENIYSITIFESIVCFRIQPSRCYENQPTSNEGSSSGAIDLRFDGSSLESVQGFMTGVAERFPFVRRIAAVKRIKNLALSRYAAFVTGRKLRRLGRFFK